jgi:arsenate reductase-like glutaredoxin family protein
MDANKIEPKDIILASQKLGEKDAEKLASNATKILVFKGKKITEFSGSKKLDRENVQFMLGPTGNLRAPTLVSGKTVLVGFNEEEFAKILL